MYFSHCSKSTKSVQSRRRINSIRFNFLKKYQDFSDFFVTEKKYYSEFTDTYVQNFKFCHRVQRLLRGRSTVGSPECFTSKFYGKVGDEVTSGLARDIFFLLHFLFLHPLKHSLINDYFACQSNGLDKIKDVERFHDLK